MRNVAILLIRILPVVSVYNRAIENYIGVKLAQYRNCWLACDFYNTYTQAKLALVQKAVSFCCAFISSCCRAGQVLLGNTGDWST